MERMTVMEHTLLIMQFVEHSAEWGKMMFGDVKVRDYGHAEILEPMVG